MNRDDPAFDADDMDALFRMVLDQPEPAAPPALLPEVRRSGVRLRRRNRLLTAAATAAAVALLATAGWAVGGRNSAGGPAPLPPAATGVTARPSTPADPPSTAGGPTGTPSPVTAGTAGATGGGNGNGNGNGSLALLTFLRSHPPEGVRQVFSTGATNGFLLTTDYGTITLSRRLDGTAELRGGTASPCGPRSNAWGLMNPEGEDCAGRTLPDGSAVWVMHPLSTAPLGREAEIRIVTPDDRVYVLFFARAETAPKPTDPTLPLPQLLDLAGQPGFLEAVRDGWSDSATHPTTTGRPSPPLGAPRTSPATPGTPGTSPAA
ncbi:hypothetical protein ACFQ6N_29060 [Kitasatospora sp. NPDC056446]|uniref:hypothetical protein n=1 Tax=Kitasatospora sp. NPDC056446 TaxID=3345819 RepID=UPI0036A4DBED